MEPQSGYNLAKKPQVYVRSGKQTRQDKAGRVFGRVWNRTELNRRAKPRPVANTTLSTSMLCYSARIGLPQSPLALLSLDSLTSISFYSFLHLFQCSFTGIGAS
jgi:hypothetical protein